MFHMRGGKMVDRREFFWEELPEFPEADPTSLPGHPEQGEGPSQSAGSIEGAGESIDPFDELRAGSSARKVRGPQDDNAFLNCGCGYALRRVSSVISGGTPRRTGMPNVPRPRFT